MKKRFLSVLLCIAMVLTFVAGCSQSEPAAPQTAEPAATNAAPAASGSDKAPAVANGAFDEFTRPVVKSEGGLKVACIHPKPEVESQKRSLIQCELEAKMRGWQFQDIVYDTDSEWADLFKNVINQGVDVIILGSTESMEAKVGLIAEARNKGIGVYSNDNQVVPGVIMNSTMPNGSAAMSLIYQIGNDYDWTAKIGFVTAAAIQVHQERILPIQAICSVYSNLEVLDTLDAIAGGSDPFTYAGDQSKAWYQKYGKEITGVIGSCDALAMPMAEAAAQYADSLNEDFFCAGIDGGSDAWSYIRNGSYFKYSYAQPFEMFTHKVFECIEDIQVDGLNPGDEGCIISKVGEVLYSEGMVITADNVPEPGANINSLFDYYTDDPSAWYNWEGTYIISE